MAILPIEKERKKVLNNMSAPLQKVALEIEATEVSMARSGLLWKWKAGNAISKALADEAEYGSNAAEQLAAYRGVNTSEIYSLRNYAETYTYEEVKELFSETMAGGITWSFKHIRSLISVESEAKRNKLYKRCKERGLTASELELDIRTVANRTGNPTAGRKPARPKSVAAGVSQMSKKTNEFNNRYPIWKSDVLDEVVQLSEDKVTEATVNELETTLENLNVMEKYVKEAKQSTIKGIKHCKKCVTSNGAAKEETSETAEPVAKRSKKKRSKKPANGPAAQARRAKKKKNRARRQPAS